MMTRTLVACVLLAGLVTGCGQPQSRKAWTSEDEWHNPPPEGTRSGGLERLARDRIHEVAEDGLAEAEKLLQDVSIVALSGEQAAGFVGGSLPDAEGTEPYLVRALLLNRGTGNFSVYLMDQGIWIRHGSLGRSAVPMTRQPLVLQLEQPPQEVYVSVSMAE
jgi:hypothetical protein